MRLLAAHRKPWSPEEGREALAWLCFFKIEDFNKDCMGYHGNPKGYNHAYPAGKHTWFPLGKQSRAFKIFDFNSPCMHLIDFNSKAQDCHPEGEDDKNVVFVRRGISYNLVLLLKSVLLKLSLFLTSRILKED